MAFLCQPRATFTSSSYANQARMPTSIPYPTAGAATSFQRPHAPQSCPQRLNPQACPHVSVVCLAGPALARRSAFGMLRFPRQRLYCIKVLTWSAPLVGIELMGLGGAHTLPSVDFPCELSYTFKLPEQLPRNERYLVTDRLQSLVACINEPEISSPRL